MNRHRLASAVALSSAILASAVGCTSGGGSTAAPTSIAPTSTVPPSSGAAPSGTETGSPTADGDSPGQPSPSGAGGAGSPSRSAGPSPRCTLNRLRVSAGPSDGAAGHWGLPLVFTNTGGTACVLRGYPGVAGLDAHGRQVTQASRAPAGSSIALVRLAPGGSASAALEGGNIPPGNATDCPMYAGLLVTPPDETHSVRLTMQTRGCSGLRIHPVVPGTDGIGQR